MTNVPREALPPGAADVGSIDDYVGWGGRALRYRTVAASSQRFELVYLHGIESHGAWFLPAAERLARLGCTTHLLDRRGSGLNRDVEPGDTPSSAAWIADVERFCEIRERPLHLAALSWGGKLALAIALEHPGLWLSLTLITPGLRARVDLPFWQKIAVASSFVLGGDGTFPVPIEPELFTTTPEYLEFIRHDPWRLHRVTARFWIASRALDRSIARRGARLDSLPMLVLLAERDRIIDNDGVTTLIRRVQPHATIFLFPDAEHALPFDQTDSVVDRTASLLRSAQPS